MGHSSSQPVGATLLPCPFCGTTALIDRDVGHQGDDDGGYYEIACTNCNGASDRFIGVHAADRQEAVTFWNTRAGAPRCDALSEEASEMLECGTADAFEEADFAILYREINESGTTTLQEITNVPQVWCQEIARQLRASVQAAPAHEEIEVVRQKMKRLKETECRHSGQMEESLLYGLHGAVERYLAALSRSSTGTAPTQSLSYADLNHPGTGDRTGSTGPATGGPKL